MVNPDQSGLQPNGTFEDYGWYSVDCNIKQYVVCKDCAYGYYFLNGCYRNCNVGDAPYDYWEVTCADDADEWNCKFGVDDSDDEGVDDGLFGIVGTDRPLTSWPPTEAQCEKLPKKAIFKKKRPKSKKKSIFSQKNTLSDRKILKRQVFQTFFIENR